MCGRKLTSILENCAGHHVHGVEASQNFNVSTCEWTKDKQTDGGRSMHRSHCE